MKPNHNTADYFLNGNSKIFTLISITILCVGAGGIFLYRLFRDNNSNTHEDGSSTEIILPLSFETVTTHIEQILFRFSFDLEAFELLYLRMCIEQEYHELHNLTIYFEKHSFNISKELKSLQEIPRDDYEFFISTLKLINVLNYYTKALENIIYERDFGFRGKFINFQKLLKIYIQEIYIKSAFKIILEYHGEFKTQIDDYNKVISTSQEDKKLYLTLKSVYKNILDSFSKYYMGKEAIVEFDKDNLLRLNVIKGSFENLKTSANLHFYLIYPFVFKVDSENIVTGFNDKLSAAINQKIEKAEDTHKKLDGATDSCHARMGAAGNKINLEVEIKKLNISIETIKNSCKLIIATLQEKENGHNWLWEEWNNDCAEVLHDILNSLQILENS